MGRNDYPVERRKRYTIESRLRFVIRLKRGSVRYGEGTSVNISSTGLAFRSSMKVIAGNYVVVSMDWPLVSDEGAPIYLLLSGPVVWVRDDLVGVLVTRYEFVRDGSAEVPPESMPGRYVTVGHSMLSTRGNVRRPKKNGVN